MSDKRLKNNVRVIAKNAASLFRLFVKMCVFLPFPCLCKFYSSFSIIRPINCIQVLQCQGSKKCPPIHYNIVPVALVVVVVVVVVVAVVVVVIVDVVADVDHNVSHSVGCHHEEGGQAEGL
jgi:hypothetical protein